jgi:hypothetical protein
MNFYKVKYLLRLSLFLSVLFPVVNAKSQVKLGPDVGINFSNMVLHSPDPIVKHSSLTGYHIGLVSEIPLYKTLTIRTGIIYTTKGYKAKNNGSYVKASPSFLELPVNLMFGYNMGKLKMFILGGPYIAYGVGGNISYKDFFNPIRYNIDLKPFDYGGNIGFGFKFNSLRLLFQDEFGIANLEAFDPQKDKVKTNSFSISLSFLIGE